MAAPTLTAEQVNLLSNYDPALHKADLAAYLQALAAHVDTQALGVTPNQVIQAGTDVLTPATSLLPSNGGTMTTAQYQIDMTVGDVQIDGVYGRLAALNDVSILGTGQSANSYTLAGGVPVVLTADGKTRWVVVVVGLVAGVATRFYIWGAEANDGSEVAPTGAQCRAALVLAAPTDLDLTALLVVARIKVKRVATDTITYTVTDPAVTAALEAERHTAILAP